MLQLKELSIAVMSLLSWLVFSDTPGDPEGYVQDATVSHMFFYLILNFKFNYCILFDDRFCTRDSCR